MADQFGGIYFAAAIVLALMAREEMRKQQADVASVDCMMTALKGCLSEAALMGITAYRKCQAERGHFLRYI